MTMLGAFYALLSRYSGAEDLVVGSASRTEALRDTEGLIGMMLNTVALRVDLSGDPSVTELLGRVRDATARGVREPGCAVSSTYCGQSRPSGDPGTAHLPGPLLVPRPAEPDLDVPGVTILPTTRAATTPRRRTSTWS